MFPSIRRLHRLDRLHHLHRLSRLRYGAFPQASRGGPSVARLLLAGLAVLAFVRLMSVASRPSRSTARRIGIAILLIAVGAIVMSFRRSALRVPE
jgi:uncharacterized membrane protein